MSLNELDDLLNKLEASHVRLMTEHEVFLKEQEASWRRHEAFVAAQELEWQRDQERWKEARERGKELDERIAKLISGIGAFMNREAVSRENPEPAPSTSHS